ncbi:MAG: type II toxin-antitoxin system VapC family toxin [Bryobacteraceae bacterium]|jgi:predicted nucleic acid-binding protein
MDASFLVSLYASDANSAAAAAYAGNLPFPFPLPEFGRLELTNAIHLRVFRREITAAQAEAALADVASDLAQGVLRSFPVSAGMYETAQRLAHKHTAAIGARALDILHVAAALELGAERFYTFDRRQARLARAEGLVTPVRIR